MTGLKKNSQTFKSKTYDENRWLRKIQFYRPKYAASYLEPGAGISFNNNKKNNKISNGFSRAVDLLFRLF